MGPDVPAFVEVRQLRKTFDGVVALQSVSFDVVRGSTISLLGPSGCGKTTVLRSIAGLETPDAGRIAIGDAVVFDGDGAVDVAPEKRQVGMVFQSYAVWPHMTVAQNVGLPLRVRRVRAARIAERVAEVLGLVGLEGLGGRPATNLSGGQQQRVALARAIVHEPRLVLFDEPLSNLDAKLRHQMRTELRLLQERLGFTAIYVTHDQEEALALADQVIVMNLGRVEGMATPRRLFARPTTPFVADFLGFDNMLAGVVARVDRAARSIAVTVDDAMMLSCLWERGEMPSPGAAVTVAFRSERVGLTSWGAPGAPQAPQRSERPAVALLDPGTALGATRWEGKVEASVYLGSYEDVLVRVGSLRLRAVGPGDGRIEPGERVVVSIRPEDCIVFPKDTRVTGEGACPQGGGSP